MFDVDYVPFQSPRRSRLWDEAPSPFAFSSSPRKGVTWKKDRGGAAFFPQA